MVEIQQTHLVPQDCCEVLFHNFAVAEQMQFEGQQVPLAMYQEQQPLQLQKIMQTEMGLQGI